MKKTLYHMIIMLCMISGCLFYAVDNLSGLSETGSTLYLNLKKICDLAARMNFKSGVVMRSAHIGGSACGLCSQEKQLLVRKMSDLKKSYVELYQHCILTLQNSIEEVVPWYVCLFECIFLCKKHNWLI